MTAKGIAALPPCSRPPPRRGGGRERGTLGEPLALAVNRGFQRASPAAAGSMETKEPQNIEQGMSKEEGGGNRREFSFAAGYSLFDILRFMDFGNSRLSLAEGGACDGVGGGWQGVGFHAFPPSRLDSSALFGLGIRPLEPRSAPGNGGSGRQMTNNKTRRRAGMGAS